MLPLSQYLPEDVVVKDKKGWDMKHHSPFPEMHTLDLQDQQTSSSSQS